MPRRGLGNTGFLILCLVVLLGGGGLAFWLAMQAAEAGRRDAARDALFVKNVSSLESAIPVAQAMYQTQRRKDRDDDGRGEFGSMAELLAAGELAADGWQEHEGVVWRGPYAYRIVLQGEPDADEQVYRVLAVAPGHPELHPLYRDEEGTVWVGPSGFDPRQQRFDPSIWKRLRGDGEAAPEG